MRLYLSGISKNGIGYTPDTLIIENGKKRYEYDIEGWTDYSSNGLNTRTKGDLKIHNAKKDDYLKLSSYHKKRLAALLSDPQSNITVSVYPQTTDDEDLVYSDIISETSGCLMIDNQEINFEHFATEFYGF